MSAGLAWHAFALTPQERIEQCWKLCGDEEDRCSLAAQQKYDESKSSLAVANKEMVACKARCEDCFQKCEEKPE